MLDVIQIDNNEEISFDYTNHRGILAKRYGRFLSLRYGTHSEYYPTPRFLIDVYDFDRKAVRTFDLSKIKNINLVNG